MADDVLRVPEDRPASPSADVTDLLKALVAARLAFAPVLKESVGQIGATRAYPYADLSSLLSATMPALLKNGLIIVQTVEAASALLVTRLYHTTGVYLESTYPIDLKQSPQSIGSQLTYGRRYSLLGLISVAAEDDDGQAASTPQPKARRPAPRPAAPPAITRDDRPEAPPINPKRRPDQEPLSEPQRRKMFGEAKRCHWEIEQLKATLYEKFGISTTRDLRTGDLDDVLRLIRKGPPPAVQPSREPGSDDVPF